MRRRLRLPAGAFAVAAFFALVTGAGAETCKLEIKKVDRSGPGRSRMDYMFGATSSQSFFMQIGGPEGMIRTPGDKEKPKFSEIAKKEPAKYAAKHPFRGVAKLGSQYFAFVFDSAPSKKAEEEAKDEETKKKETKKDEKKSDAKKDKKPPKPVSYTRLYFDVNHNGDLTDDEVVEARTTRQYGSNYAYSAFPPVDLEIDVDGTKTPYAFRMDVHTNTSRQFSYVNGSLNAAAYREGEMTFDGKKYRVVIVDFNSNGRFDDASSINKSVRTSGGGVYPNRGDRLFVIDPEAKSVGGSPYDVSSNDALHYVGALVNLGGAFYDLKITPAGDELSLSPSSIPVGYVTNPNEGYRAVVYSDGGFLKVVGNAEGKAPLPEGEWKLLSYTLDRTGWTKPEEPKPEDPEKKDAERKDAEKKDPDKKAEAKADEKAEAKGAEKSTEPAKSLLGVLLKAVTPRTSQTLVQPAKPKGPTVVSARGTRDYKPVKVEKGKTVELPFGPPYRPVVSVQYVDPKKREARLALSILGAADESCSDLRVNGRRPDKPKFTITTKDGKEVVSGAFEYG